MLTTKERARDARKTPVFILGAAEAAYVDYYLNLPYPLFPPEGGAVRRATDIAFAMAGIARKDIDVAGLYDCFTVTVLRDLEEMGFCQLGLFAGFAIYLPELFPTRLRSTGTSFCYNVGRFIAASGPFTLGELQQALAAGVTTPAAKLAAFRSAACYLSVIFLFGLVAVFFLRETKGQPLPEDGPAPAH